MNVQLMIVFMVLFRNCFCSHNRYKRVVNGVPLNDLPNGGGRPTTYTAIRYYGALSSAYHSVWLEEILSFIGLGGQPFCSGSLISPKIFHTACHCVATFQGHVNDFIKPPSIASHWENRAVIYFGVSNRYGKNSMETYRSVLTERFIVHQRCGRLGNVKAPTYDYAVIQLPYEWIKSDDRTPYPWTEIEYAPLYSIKQTTEFHKYALMKQLVCLHIGFGIYDRYTLELSDVLRTGWAVLWPRPKCVKWTATIDNKDLGDNPLVNWVCSGNFSHHEQEGGGADSGGPVTCNNRYYAIMSGKNYYLGNTGIQFNIITKYHPFIHDLFITTYEFRDALIHSIDDLKGSYKDFVEELYRTSTNAPRRSVLKLQDISYKIKSPNLKVPLHTSQGLDNFAFSFALNVAIWIHIL